VGWLRHKKRAWRAAAEARKRRRTEAAKARGRGGAAAAPQLPAGPGADVGAFFRAQAQAAAHMHWQIVHLAPTHTPGVESLYSLSPCCLGFMQRSCMQIRHP
jgi:hypothetical protein